ncbi:hypothetical protein LJC56_00290 [Christensenellaceae bacterium OttesenSCG-928-K19]|nr:hypothetical protein [Christensenellaceae bacterium OttesenSCG-928-K19]
MQGFPKSQVRRTLAIGCDGQDAPVLRTHGCRRSNETYCCVLPGEERAAGRRHARVSQEPSPQDAGDWMRWAGCPSIAGSMDDAGATKPTAAFCPARNEPLAEGMQGFPKSQVRRTLAIGCDGQDAPVLRAAWMPQEPNPAYIISTKINLYRFICIKRKQKNMIINKIFVDISHTGYIIVKQVNYLYS